MCGDTLLTWIIIFFIALKPAYLVSENGDSLRQKAVELFHQAYDQSEIIYSSDKSIDRQNTKHFKKNFKKSLSFFEKIPQESIIPIDAYYVLRIYHVLEKKIPDKKLPQLIKLIEDISLIEKKVICYKILGEQAISFNQDADLAIYYYEKALFSETGSDLNIHYQLFELYSQVGKKEKSHKHLEAIINHPSSFSVPEITFRAGYYLADYYYTKNVEKSIEIYKRLYPLRYIAKKEEKMVLLYRLINFAFNKLEYKNLYFYYTELNGMSDETKYREFFFIFGFLYSRDKWEKSPLFDELTFLVDEQSNIPRKKFLQAIYYYYQNNQKRSLGILKELLNEKIWQVHALSALCSLLDAKENYHEKVYFEKILFDVLFQKKLFDKINETIFFSPDVIEKYPEYNYYFGYMSIERHETNKAKQYFLKYLQSPSSHEVMLLTIASYFESLGDYSNASLSIDKLLKTYPEKVEYLLYSAYINREKGNPHLANEILEKALKVDPHHRDALYSLGVNYYYLDDFEKVSEVFKTLIEIYPQTADYYNFLGYTMAEKKVDLIQAKSLIEKALDFEPRNEAYLDSLAWVFYQLKDYKKAKEYIDKAIAFMEKKNQNDAIIYEHAGDIYRQLKNIELAKMYWQKCLALNYENSDFVLKKIKELSR